MNDQFWADMAAAIEAAKPNPEATWAIIVHPDVWALCTQHMAVTTQILAPAPINALQVYEDPKIPEYVKEHLFLVPYGLAAEFRELLSTGLSPYQALFCLRYKDQLQSLKGMREGFEP
jgi:hypothetical protein